MGETYEFLKECGIFYLATDEDGQPRVRPFGAVDIFEDKLYIQTGRVKPVCGSADGPCWTPESRPRRTCWRPIPG